MLYHVASFTLMTLPLLLIVLISQTLLTLLAVPTSIELQTLLNLLF
jgi:hypothetical protein